MKKLKLYLLTVSMFAVMSAGYTQTTVSLGAGYVFDVYYSMQNGISGITIRAEWDLGFYTNPGSAGIITNGSSGIELRLYPYGDTTAWMSIDTNGMSTWPILYNGEDSWENGAFNRNTTVYPDKGWGVYNSTTQSVVGDSLYIIKLMDGTYKKLWIVRKIFSENKYVIRYADLDNSYEKERILNNDDYVGMNFSYFDFESESFFDREPDTEDWDILFTKYMGMHPTGVPFAFVGVLDNVGTLANKFHPVTLDFNDWSAQPMDSSKAVIGWDWKYFNFGLMQYEIVDSTVFFIKSQGGDIYKLYFTYFVGTSNGDIIFEDDVVSLVDIDDITGEEARLNLSPNPASGFVNLKWEQNSAANISIHVFDIGGKEVLYKELNAGGQSDMHIRLDVSDLHQGMYLVRIVSGNKVINEKMLIE